MKIILHAIRTNPSHIEEIQMEDVSNLSINDNSISIAFNDGSTEKIPLRANDGKEIHEWSGFSIFGTRIGLKIE